jgi:hypothetical protein
MKRKSLGFSKSCAAFGFLLALGLSACGSDDTDDPACECPLIVADNDCDTSKRPFVFVHGTFGSGDNIANVAMLFGSNGYCQDRFLAVEYNSLGGNPIARLDALIDKVLAETGADKVELAGHSQGTMHCGTYMGDPVHAAKVAHYINYSGRTAPAGIPTLSISSNNDLGGGPIHPSGPDVTQITLDEEDHFANAASVNAFIATWEYLYGEAPQYTTIQCGEDPVTVEGIAESFGDNVPVANSTMEIYELGDSPRARGEPVITLTANAEGRIGPVKLKRNVPYEFKAFDTAGKLVGYVYFAPFKRSNRLARFLKPSDNWLISLLTTARIVRRPNHAALVGRYLGGAFRADLNNSLKIDGNEVLTDENAGRSDSVVGLFMYDGNTNGSSELGSLFTAPFIVGTDVFMDTTSPAWIELEWNDPTNGSGTTTMRIPNWPSSEALTLVYF